MLIVVGGNVFVGNVDLRSDFLVEHLFDGDGAAQIGLEVGERNSAVGEALVEVLLAERRLDLSQFAIDFVVGGQQAEFLGTLHQDFVVDQLLQDIQPESVGLFVGGLLGSFRRLVVVVLVHLGAEDLAAVDQGHDAFGVFLGVAARA